MSESTITSPALCSAPSEDDEGRECTVFFETRERAESGEWIAARRTATVGDVA